MKARCETPGTVRVRCATAVSSRYVAAAQALRSVALNGQPSTCAFHPATHVHNPAHLRSALTTKSATSARVMLPQTVTSSAGEMQGKWFVGGKLGSQYQPNPTLKLWSGDHRTPSVRGIVPPAATNYLEPVLCLFFLQQHWLEHLVDLRRRRAPAARVGERVWSSRGKAASLIG